MSALKVEATEPDPAATSLLNDQTVNKEGGDSAAPTERKDAEMTDAESKKTNGQAEAKEGKTEKEEKSAATTESKATKENGNSRTHNRDQSNRKSYNSYSNNSKYDPGVLPNTDDPKKIRAQVEFYFSDANLPTDKFMWEMTDGATNLPVSVSKICSFGRMKRFQPYSAVVAALRDSHFLEVTGVEGQEEVKRKVAYDPTVPRSKVEARSVYVKGFGDEEPSSQFDIEAFFAPYGPTNAVRLRRTDDKLFKGSVFVEFQDEETAKKFLDLEDKPIWKGKNVLEIKSKTEYVEGKRQDIKDGKMEPKETWATGMRGRGRGGRGFRGGNRGGRGRDDRDRGDRSRGDRDPDDWKRRREEDRASGFKNDRRGDRRGNNRDRDNKRGGRRDNRGPQDRNREREEREDGDDKAEAKTEVKEEAAPEQAVNEKKRAREDDGGESEAPAKKVDTKSEVAAEAS